MDDNLSDGNTTIQVLVRVDNASTADNRYHGLSRSLTVTNVDNETSPTARYGETLSAGANYTCAVLDNGSAMCRGKMKMDNIEMEAPYQEITTLPQATLSISATFAQFQLVAKNHTHTCAMLDVGSLCVGRK